NVDVFAKVVLQPLLSAPATRCCRPAAAWRWPRRRPPSGGPSWRTWPGRRCWRSNNSTRLRLDAINNSDWAAGGGEGQGRAVADKVREKSAPDQRAQTPGACSSDSRNFLRSRRDGRRSGLSELQQANSSRARQEDIRAKLVGLRPAGRRSGPTPRPSRGERRRRAPTCGSTMTS
uniref:IBB domain-containing protein n=1 Tax=Macrostomum lignano TaxID=282301 RepID=A0A1I8FIX6_9PLAT